MILTTTHLIEMVQELPLNQQFAYVNAKSKSVVEILGVNTSESLITLKRTTKDNTCKESRVNFSKLKIIAEGLVENTPISIDDLLRNNDNVRSAIEAILVRTAEIYTYVVKNHKTMVWVPSKPHKSGIIVPLSPSDYHLVRQRSISTVDSRMLSAISNLAEREINETRELRSSITSLSSRIQLNMTQSETERISRSLNEVSSKVDALMERQNRIFQLLIK